MGLGVDSEGRGRGYTGVACVGVGRETLGSTLADAARKGSTMGMVVVGVRESTGGSVPARGRLPPRAASLGTGRHRLGLDVDHPHPSTHLHPSSSSLFPLLLSLLLALLPYRTPSLRPSTSFCSSL